MEKTTKKKVQSQKRLKINLNEQKVRKAIRKMIANVIKEIITEARGTIIEFPPYALELTRDSQVVFKKNGKMFKAVDVKPTFNKYDLIKLAQTYAKKFNTSITTDLRRL